jgi:hypothetical protein
MLPAHRRLRNNQPQKTEWSGTTLSVVNINVNVEHTLEAIAELENRQHNIVAVAAQHRNG